jgi:hypothetical protein
MPDEKPAIRIRFELDVEPAAVESVKDIVANVKAIVDKAEKLGPLAGLVEKFLGKKGEPK